MKGLLVIALVIGSIQAKANFFTDLFSDAKDKVEDVVDSRTPTEKCVDYLKENFPITNDHVTACQKIRSKPAVACVKAVTKKSVSLGRVHYCGYVNTEETVKAVEAVADKFVIDNDMTLVLSFADQKHEVSCMVKLSEQGSLSLADMKGCLDENFWDLGKREAEMIWKF